MSKSKESNISHASSYTTSEPDGSVLIRSESTEFFSTSVPSLVKNYCLAGGSRTALAVKRKGEWVKMNYDEYHKNIRLAAKGFIKLGLKPYHSVCIYSFNCPEWFISDLGAIFAGGLATGLYPTNSASTNEYLMNNSRCQILVVENQTVLMKVKEVLPRVSTLKKVIVIEEEGFVPDDSSMLWKDLIDLGRLEGDEELEERLKNIKVNQCCTLIYSSGTTGPPKGVMLSHDNITFMVKVLIKKHDWNTQKAVIVSYLPLSHVAANVLDIYISIYLKGEVYFADKFAFRGTLVETLKEVHPTLFFGVPRVWEKFQEGITEKSVHLKKSQVKVTQVFKEASLHYHESGDQKIIHKIGDKLIFQKVKAALGLEKCIEFLSGGAPLPLQTQDFFMGLDIPIQECYGLSECGVFCSVQKNVFKPGSCGTILPATLGKVVRKENEQEGELWIKGRCVMMGYLGNPKANKESFDSEGYFCTGDLGFRDKNEHYHITGRAKDILITAGGENVAPIPIENAIKKALPALSNVVAVGEGEKFISVFLTFKVKFNEQGEPTHKLAEPAMTWLKGLGCNDSTVGAVLYHRPPHVMRAIQKGIDEANKLAVSNAARVKKWTILPKELSVEAGELGPTLKLKRKAFKENHEHLIHKLCS